MLNTRGLESNLQTVDSVARLIVVFQISEKYIKTKDSDLMHTLDGNMKAPEAVNRSIGYSGDGIFVNPLVPHNIIDELSTTRVQTISAIICSNIVTMIYISPRSRADQEMSALDRLNRTSVSKALIMDDLNAHATKWYYAGGTRGARLSRWAGRHVREVEKPNEPLFSSNIWTSAPDIFFAKEVTTTRVQKRSD